MEFQFEPVTCEFLQEVLFAPISQEETGETIVPDSCPDVERVLDAFGSVVLRGKECRSGSASISGGVHAGVLYAPEDHSAPRTLHYYIPFTIRVDNSALTEQSQISVDCRVRSADARILNSRKVMVRVNLCGSVTGYEPATQELYHPEPDQTGDLQLKPATYPVLRALATAEKPFSISEEVELPGGSPMRELCRSQMSTDIVESRIVGNKGVFKGNVSLRLLYLTEEGELCPWSCQLPFSQYVEFDKEYEDQELQVKLAVTDLTVEDANGQGRRLLAELQMLAQCTALGQEELEIVEDAFSLRHAFTPEWKELNAAGRLDRQRQSEVVRAAVQAPRVKSVVDTQVFLDEPVARREGETVKIVAPMTASVLYRDEEGELQGAATRMEVACQTELAENCTCRPGACISGEAFAVPAGDGLEVRCTVDFTLDSLSAGALKTLCGGKIGDEPLPEEERPSVILRPAAPEDTLWSLAKQCRTTMASIRDANVLGEDEAVLSGMLLIPIVK